MTTGHTIAMRAAQLADWLLRYDMNAETAFNDVLVRIGNGDSLVAIAAEYGLDYGSLAGWCRMDKDRSTRLEFALADRKQRDAELGRAAVLETLSEKPALPPTHGERMKAAALLMPKDVESAGGITVNIVNFAGQPIERPQRVVRDA